MRAPPPSRTTIIVREHKSVEVEIDEALAARIHADRHMAISPVSAGRYELKAKSKVGVLHYGDIEIRIVPKVSISRLLYLASYRHDPTIWINEDTELGEADDPLSAIAEAFANYAERAVRPAPLQGYQTHEESQWNLRGRVLFGQQIARRAGVLLPVELRFDEFEIDVVENQIIKGALVVLDRAVSEPGLRRRLAHVRNQLDGVAAWPAEVTTPQVVWTRLNERYRPAIALARLILDRQSLEFPDQTTFGTSFLFNMNTVFESFLTARLRRELEATGGAVVSQYPVYLDHGDELLMKPDISWWRGSECVAVIDAKYKRVVNASYPNADAYQMLAYCTRLELRQGWLVYADLDGHPPSGQLVRGAGVELRAAAIDLSCDLDSLDRSIEQLAGAISLSLGSSQHSL